MEVSEVVLNNLKPFCFIEQVHGEGSVRDKATMLRRHSKSWNMIVNYSEEIIDDVCIWNYTLIRCGSSLIMNKIRDMLINNKEDEIIKLIK